MEPLSNERIQQALQRWRSVDGIGLGQFSPVSGSPSDLRFMMDDTLLTELMDLDPLVAQSPESWLNVSSPGSDSFFTFTSSPPSLPVSSPLFYAVNSVTNPPCSQPAHSSGLPRAPESEVVAQHIKSRAPGGVSLALAKVRSVANNLSPPSFSEDLAYVASLSGLLDGAGYAEHQQDGASSSQTGGNGGSDFKRSTEANSRGQSRALPEKMLRGSLDSGLRGSLDNPVHQGESSIEEKVERSDDFLDVLSSDTDLIFTGGKQDTKEGRQDLLNDSNTDELLKRRMKLALDAINFSAGGGTLTQIWMPTTHGDRLILSTRDQPFAVADDDSRLGYYRNVSANFVFPTENGSSEYPGLPGRVFLTRAPEWTPNVMYYTSQEFLRVSYAAQCQVKGTIAVPVFDESSNSKNCLAVIELISKTEKVKFKNEIEIICNALKKVNLSTTVPQGPSRAIPSEGRQTALAEILEVQTAVCETHKLPLAQTWIPCWTEGAVGISEIGDSGPSMHVSPNMAASFSGEPRVILQTANAPCYVADHSVWGFRHACAEHILERNQGVPGKAFSSNQPVFETDVRKYSKLEYPLGHYAKMFSLSAAVAIRLRSIYSGSDDYVLEFYLPPSCVDGNEQQQLLNALSITMQRVCRSLRTVTSKEIAEENDNRYSDNDVVETGEELVSRTSPKPGVVHPTKDARVGESQPHVDESRQQQPLSPHQSPDITPGEADVHDPWRSHPYQQHDSAAGSGHEGSSMKRRLDRRRGTNEKTIGLNVLQQYFAGSLKDAAKSIGVCPTTLKRICRQHGISRWPSRKINKVSRSLKKLQGVIDSVQGADGALRINADLASAAAAAAAAVSGVQFGGQDNGYAARNKWTVSWTGSGGAGGLTDHAEGQNGSDEEGKTPTNAAVGSVSPSADTNLRSLGVDVDMVAKVDAAEHPGTDGIPRDEGCNRGPSVVAGHGKVRSRTGENRVHGGAAALAALRGVNGDEKVLGCSRLGFAGLASDYRALQLSGAEENQSSSGGDGSSHDINSSPSGTRGSDCGSPSSGVGSHQRMSPTAHEESSSTTVKATYGQDTIRFKLSPNSNYKDVRDEVASRLKLNVQNTSLKYLDDDAEWVLLACDADLEECLEVMRSTRSHAIKLMVRSEGSSGGGGGSSSGSTGEQ